MNRIRLGLLLSLVVGVGLVWAAMSAMVVGPAVAGPAPAPTPISVPAGGGDWVMAKWHDTQLMTVAGVSYNGRSLHLPGYTAVDLQYTIDVTATGVQTAACYLQFSNDNASWDQPGLLLFTNRDADGAWITQTNLFARYGRVTCTVEYADAGRALTMTVEGKLHN